MAMVIAYGGEGPDEFLSALSVMHEYVFGVFMDLHSWTFPMFIFELDFITQLPEALAAYFLGLYDDLTAFELYKASQVQHAPMTHAACPST